MGHARGALERGQTWWLVLAFSCVGVGFLAKELQALLVVPAFACVRHRRSAKLGRRAVQLAAAGGVLVVSGLVGRDRAALACVVAPYIGGSQNNSLWNVLFGYNGFGRLTGNETGSVVGGGAQGTAGRWGPTGLLRMFNAQFGGEASWLIPATVIMLGAGLVFTARMPRTDRTRAALLLWGGWLVVTAGAFSLGQGIIHPYYTVALAPAIGALVGIGATRLWNGRGHPGARAVLVVAFAATAWWSYQLLGRTPDWHPRLRTFVLLGGIAGSILLAISASPALRRAQPPLPWALVIVLAGPAAYTLSTAANAHTARFHGRTRARRPRGGPGTSPDRPTASGTAERSRATAGIREPQRFRATVVRLGPDGRRRAGVGGLLNGPRPRAAHRAPRSGCGQLHVGRGDDGRQQHAGYQLATGDPVMAVGGFNGTDPSPTLAQFQAYVAAHKIHYFIGGGGFGRGGGPGASSARARSRSGSRATSPRRRPGNDALRPHERDVTAGKTRRDGAAAGAATARPTRPRVSRSA